MEKNKLPPVSRRKFLKTGSAFWLGQFIVNDPSIGAMAECFSINNRNSGDFNFSCELLRPADMLRIKYYFFNAHVSWGHAKKVLKNEPMYIYIKVPGQHIAEELVTEDFTAFVKKGDFHAKKSFLASSSWLAFKLAGHRNSIILHPDILLDWSSCFELITIDDFASKDFKTLSTRGYDETLISLKKALENTADPENPVFYPLERDLKVTLPLTMFSIPYKMWLSPIAEPIDEFVVPRDPQEKRAFGEHQFKLSNELVTYCRIKEGKNQLIEIVSPWENALVFKDIRQNKLLQPRFKVVSVACEETKVDHVALLPYPVHRFELNGLTMLPEYDRDVLSEMFRISALGGTVNLKYHNDDPTSLYSIISWEQRIKYGRDNYVAITVRAIDYFTGLKLKVSIIADRQFKLGVSFLPKWYYVTYAEKRKECAKPVVISKIPYKTIIPQSQGVYFKPCGIKDLAGAADDQYIVTKQYKEAFDVSNNLIAENLIELDYAGVDKDGNTCYFKSKMIFILAESYVITYGHFDVPGVIYPKGNGETVNIIDVGWLNPAKQDLYVGKPRAGCDLDDKADYKYKLEKTFKASNYATLNTILANISKHVDAHRDVYTSGINKTITYARLDALRVKDIIKNIKGIDKKAQTASFKTKGMLLGAVMNVHIFPKDGSGDPNKDNFFDYFPIVPAMQLTTVVVPQIDQMEGASSYHGMKYYQKYWDNEAEIDDDKQNADNRYRIFFELSPALGNFFSDNYRSAGAMVNPGINISHVSAFDNSIAYNSRHNELPAPVGFRADDKLGIGSSPTSFIFRELNAEILGISVLQILAEVIGLDEIPSFKFLEDILHDIDKIEKWAIEYKKYADQWTSEYNSLKTQLDGYLAQIDQLRNELRSLSKADVKSWLESLINQIVSKYFYQQKQVALASIAEYKTYVTKNLLPLYDYVSKIHTSLNNLNVYLDQLLNDPSIANLLALLEIVANLKLPDPTKFNESYFKEAVKAYYANKFINAGLKAEVFQKLASNMVGAKEKINAAYLSYYDALNQSLQEATDFSTEMVGAQAARLKIMVDEQIKNIPFFIVDLLHKTDVNLSVSDFNTWVDALYQLITIYEHYYTLYKSLKKEYYEQLYVLLTPVPNSDDIAAIEKSLITHLISELTGLPEPAGASSETLKRYKVLKDSLLELAKNHQSDLLHEYTTYAEGVKNQIADVNQVYTDLIKTISGGYDQMVTSLVEKQSQVLGLQESVDNFMRDKLNDLTDQLNKKLIVLANTAKDNINYNELLNDYNELTGFINAIRAASTIRANYTFRTKKFHPASLGGIIDFKPEEGITELILDIKYQLELKITSFDQQPTIGKQIFTADTSLTRFKIGLLSFLYIDFEEVRFVASSYQKDDFTVSIRDVQFAGCLSFFQIFQSFLKSLTDDFAFDINADGVSISYSLPIPNITTGYFNFFGLSLSAMVTLPFHPNKALEIRFGIGDPLNKFGLTLMGIFGGQGYFNIIANPKEGIVGMEIVVEFGAIFHLDIIVASGSACLVGGIYIRQYNHKWDLRAYILCAGRLNVLGIFSASLSFYLGLEGNSQVIAGRCTLKASCKIGFFEISAHCEMYKEIQGTKTQETQAEEERQLRAKGLKIVTEDTDILDTNVNHQLFFPGDQLYFTIDNSQFKNGKPTVVLLSNGRELSVLPERSNNIYSGTTEISYDLTNFSPGHYTAEIELGTTHIYEFVVADEDNDLEAKGLTVEKDIVTSRSYYSSYYIN